MNKKQASSKGGHATFAKYGREHMQDIGAKGALVTWTRYIKLPWKQSHYALIEKESGKVKRILNS